MLKKFNFHDIIPQLTSTVAVLRDTIPFIKKHKLWKGYFDYRWIALLSIVISVMFTVIAYKNLSANYFAPLEPQIEMTLNQDVGETVGDVKSESKRGAVTSGTKYILIILLEVIIFYFSVKTLGILSDRPRRPTFKEFVRAEKRMIKIMIINFIKGVIALAIVSAFLSIIGYRVLSPFIMFIVYSYFMGYAFLDNYNEQFDHTIKNSQAIIRQNIGGALGIGIVISLLIYIPLLGPLFGPIFGSVAAAIYGERYKIENDVEVAILTESA